jgi:gas vesicle protein
MNDKSDGTIYFLAGLLLGGLVGAGVGMLVAPESGDKTLAKLRKQGEQVVKKGFDAVDDFQKKQLEPTVEKFSKEIKSRIPRPETAKKVMP